MRHDNTRPSERIYRATPETFQEAYTYRPAHRWRDGAIFLLSMLAVDLIFALVILFWW